MKIQNLLTALKWIALLVPFFVDAKTNLDAPNPANISEKKWSTLKAAVEETELTANDGVAHDWYGFSVSISGDWALIGARYHDENGFNSGAAYVYKFDGNDWIEETKLLPDEVGPEDEFGAAVSMSGNWALIGATKDDDNGENSGAAYLFHFNGVNWEQYQKLLASDGVANDIFGATLSLHDTRAMVSAILDDDRGDASGSVYVYDFDGVNWIESDKLYADNRANDQFGTAISLNGDQALISMVLDDDNGVDSGAVYYFEKTTQWGWVQNSKLFADDASAQDHFGFSVSLQEGRALIGARTSYVTGQGSGSAYYFENDGSGWDQKEKITANNDAVAGFGWVVKLVDNRAIITAPFNDAAGDDAGSAFVYEFINNSWLQTDKLIGNNTTTNDYFGISAGFSGGKVLIGASLSDRGFTNTGSAYVFDLEPKFNVFVSVSGLLGDSVVLRNGEDNVTMTDNGVGLISTLLDGADYDVDIISQPQMPNQVCGFSNNNAGTLNGADYTVIVNCVTSQYSIGGVLSGLINGNEMVLQNNLGDSLNVYANGPFTFSTPLDDGSDFDVTIKVQPQDPIQPCHIFNGTGVIDGNDVDDVFISCDFGDDLIYHNGFDIP
jgi:hypothetical protein